MYSWGWGSKGTRISSLILHQTHYSQLRRRLRKNGKCHIPFSRFPLLLISWVSATKLEGIKFNSLKTRRVCAALRGEYCFYSNHLDIVKDSMAKMWEGLEKWKRDWEASRGWFDHSLWLTTLSSTLLGPLMILLLLITLGPCLLSRLLQDIKQRLGTIQLMVMRGQYQILESERVLEWWIHDWLPR